MGGIRTVLLLPGELAMQGGKADKLAEMLYIAFTRNRKVLSYRIIESVRLEKTFTTIEANR